MVGIAGDLEVIAAAIALARLDLQSDHLTDEHAIAIEVEVGVLSDVVVARDFCEDELGGLKKATGSIDPSALDGTIGTARRTHALSHSRHDAAAA
jgi:hypothetical protein